MARLAPPSGLLVEIKWALSMAAALPKSLLADMSEQQQIDVAVQLSKTAADAERLQVSQRASLEDWRRQLVRVEQHALVASFATAGTPKQRGSDDDDVACDEAATAAAAAARKRRKVMDEQVARPPSPGSPRARAAEAAVDRDKKRGFQRLASQQRMRLPHSMYTRLRRL